MKGHVFRLYDIISRRGSVLNQEGRSNVPLISEQEALRSDGLPLFVIRSSLL